MDCVHCSSTQCTCVLRCGAHDRVVHKITRIPWGVERNGGLGGGEVIHGEVLVTSRHRLGLVQHIWGLLLWWGGEPLGGDHHVVGNGEHLLVFVVLAESLLIRLHTQQQRHQQCGGHPHRLLHTGKSLHGVHNLIIPVIAQPSHAALSTELAVQVTIITQRGGGEDPVLFQNCLHMGLLKLLILDVPGVVNLHLSHSGELGGVEDVVVQRDAGVVGVGRGNTDQFGLLMREGNRDPSTRFELKGSQCGEG